MSFSANAAWDDEINRKRQDLQDNRGDPRGVSSRFSIVKSDELFDYDEYEENHLGTPSVITPPKEQAVKARALGVVREIAYTAPAVGSREEDGVRKIAFALFLDLKVNFMTYLLLTVLCCLAVFKVYQVHETRILIDAYNNVCATNERLELEWLKLTSLKQNLTSHTEIRRQAGARLGMVSPDPQDEIVITLR